MKTNQLRFVFGLLILAGMATTASAGDHEWFSSQRQYPAGSRQVYKHGKLWPPYPRACGPKEPYMHVYHRVHYWPYPYVCEDRSIVRQVAQQQADNGWMNYTTLYDYHFDGETQELNQAGRLKLEWIAFYSPARYRTVYVAKALDPRDSDIRLANATATVTAMCGDEEPAPPICLRRAQSIGTPAEEVYLIRGAYLLSTPEPRLQYRFNAADTQATE